MKIPRRTDGEPDANVNVVSGLPGQGVVRHHVIEATTARTVWSNEASGGRGRVIVRQAS
jgi:hypothetical protein